MSGILLKGGRVIDPARGLDGVADVRIQDGMIAEVGADLSAHGSEPVDAAGFVVAPGFVDMHCHLREPGHEYRETIATGTRAAALGGFTAVAPMANTEPVNDNAAVTAFILDRARREGAARVLPVGAVTKGLLGRELTQMGELKTAGCVALSDDGHAVSTARMMRLALQYASQFGLLVIDHCEEPTLTQGGAMNEGVLSTMLGLAGIPGAAEEIIVARDIALAASLGLRVHLTHLSTAGSVALVREAKARGVRVTADTCPHYVAATEALIGDYDTNAKVNPPLRGEADRAAVIAGLADGTLDCIATDHAPHHADEKNVEFDLAANGISGFESAFTLCHTALVASGALTLPALIEKMSLAPARILSTQLGTLSPGAAADIVVLDPGASCVIDPDTFYSKGKNSPFRGYAGKGRVVHTLLGGRFVVRDGALAV